MLTDSMCSASVIALMFTSFERLSLYARDKDDAMNAINAATLTGALFKSTTGLRQSIAWAIREKPLFFLDSLSHVPLHLRTALRY